MASAVVASIAIAGGGLAGLALAPVVVPVIRVAEVGPTGEAVRAALADRPADDALAGFYRGRGYRPLWIEGGRMRPEAADLVATLQSAGRDDLDPTRYRPQALAAALEAARSGAPVELARAEVMASSAFAAYVADLRTPPPAARMAFVDPAVPAAPVDARAIMAEAAAAPTLGQGLAAAERMNPIYEALRSALANERDPRAAALLRVNLARARGLPVSLGDRYIVVNPAAQLLWLYEGGAAALEMPVIVGKQSEPTPQMMGLIRYADLNPYWNVPPDLAREIARRVVARGPEVLAEQQLEALSDWGPEAATLAPEAVDWRAVADGAQPVRLRQLPGPDNMMGKLKFMLPNPLGVYLHDTPMKGLFAGSRRMDSSGCVRLLDAAALGRRLFGRDLVADPAGGPEQRVDLPIPVPVYIVYLTAEPTPGGGISYLPDIYGRDPALLKTLPPREEESGEPREGRFADGAKRPAFGRSGSPLSP
jgi:murein L,D-transpeptidase YcbB/YkuD